ncbi:MAG: 4-hydroxybenzoate octaprenyltransferase [Desulfuromonas sp.]|nr:MAG: 4-hydroxybenzoate octaprenyltransferase [Desulfuromonas sp.]
MFEKIAALLRMIKFSHTIFAFPFALMGVVLASLASRSIPEINQILWICVAMVGARSAAMGLNRIIDARIDAANPRTAAREIPAGKVSIKEAVAFVVVALALLLFAAWMLNPLCLYLSPVAIFFLFLYSYCKRFTSLAHLVLGICLAAAPLGAWIALRGDIGWPAVVLALAVLLWVAGFYIFYALQDIEFDRQQGLHSIPVHLGPGKSIILVRYLHVGMIILLLALGMVDGLGLIYLVGVGVISLMLIYEHMLVKADDLSRLDAAFFNMNGYISVTIFLFALLDAVI